MMISEETQLFFLGKKLYELKKKYHTCQDLLPLKKKLEKQIKKIIQKNKMKGKSLQLYFMTPFSKRKESFYNCNEIDRKMNGFVECTEHYEIHHLLWRINNIYLIKRAEIEAAQTEMDNIISERELREEKFHQMVDCVEKNSW